jgi:hypothetical protein
MPDWAVFCSENGDTPPPTPEVPPDPEKRDGLEFAPCPVKGDTVPPMVPEGEVRVIIGPVEGTAKGVGVVFPPPCKPNRPEALVTEGVEENILFPHPDLVMSIGVLISVPSPLGPIGEENPQTGGEGVGTDGVTLYFFSSFLISSCSCPLYFSSSFGISSSFVGLCFT